jgi:hypothetical protein
MNERQKRLKEVYEYLRYDGKVHTQMDFAELIKAKRPGMSAALNGNEKYLTDNLFKKIHAKFPQFNLDYLLHGDGNLLTTREDSYQASREVYFPSVAKEPDTLPSLPKWADTLIDIMSEQIQKNEALNRELRQSIHDVNTLRTDLHELIEKINKKS